MSASQCLPQLRGQIKKNQAFQVKYPIDSVLKYYYQGILSVSTYSVGKCTIKWGVLFESLGLHMIYGMIPLYSVCLGYAYVLS